MSESATRTARRQQERPLPVAASCLFAPARTLRKPRTARASFASDGASKAVGNDFQLHADTTKVTTN